MRSNVNSSGSKSREDEDEDEDDELEQRLIPRSGKQVAQGTLTPLHKGGQDKLLGDRSKLYACN